MSGDDMDEDRPGHAAIDLRSDFLARPSGAMRAAADAARDSLCFGLREDPWQRRLEARIADLLGMEDALVFPTCTMANTTALILAAPPGSVVPTQPDAHMLVSEAGAGAALAGVTLAAVASNETERAAGDSAAMPAPSAWDRALGGSPNVQRPDVRLAVLENTHNRGGGVALPRGYVDDVVAIAARHGARLHLDGSRLFNAAEALQLPLAALARGFETVSISLNKTFGAPIAALLAGSRASIERALVIRQRLGGGIRPTGPASAATLAGLDDTGHLAEVHALARRLADALAGHPSLVIRQPTSVTNMVVAAVSPPDTPDAFAARCEAQGLRILALDARHVRFVIYRGIDAAQVGRAIAIVRSIGAVRGA